MNLKPLVHRILEDYPLRWDGTHRVGHWAGSLSASGETAKSDRAICMNCPRSDSHAGPLSLAMIRYDKMPILLHQVLQALQGGNHTTNRGGNKDAIRAGSASSVIARQNRASPLKGLRVKFCFS